MGAAEMYRETGDAKYLTLAKGLIAIRDSVENGEDHNQDRHKFREQYEAMGHAVRANYLYAGVADLYYGRMRCPLRRRFARRHHL